MNRYIKVLEIILLLIISFFLIFYRFNQVPKNLSFDEVEFAKLALSLEKQPYTPYSLLATGHSTLYFYIILISFRIFGITNFALRFPSALFGILSVILFYLIMFNVQRSTLNNKSPVLKFQILNSLPLPFLLSTIFISMRWYFNFARFAFEATFLLFLELGAIYFFFTYLKSKKIKDIFFTGLLTGLAFNSYIPGRIFFLLPLFYIILNLPTCRRGRFQNPVNKIPILSYSGRNDSNKIKQLLYFLIPFIIIITPLSLYFMKNQDLRVNQQFFLKNSKLSTQKKADFIGQNIIKTALMFNFKGDLNGRQNYPGKPALNPILGILFVSGLIIALVNIKNFYNQFFLVYFLISITPTVLTYPWENPHMLRTFTLIPSIVYFMGRSITFILKRYKQKYVLFLMFLLIVMSSAYEIRTYFLYQNQAFKHAFEMKGGLPSLLKK